MAAQLDARLVMARIAAMKQLRSMLPSDAAVRGVVAAIAEPFYAAAENHSSSIRCRTYALSWLFTGVTLSDRGDPVAMRRCGVEFYKFLLKKSSSPFELGTVLTALADALEPGAHPFFAMSAAVHAGRLGVIDKFASLGLAKLLPSTAQTAFRADGLRAALESGALPRGALPPALVAALLEAEQLRAAGSDSSAASTLRELCEPLDAELFAVDLFEESFAAALLADVDAFEATGLPVSRPNSMNKYGVVVNDVGFEHLITTLQRFVLQPLASALYGGRAGGDPAADFDAHHSFVVRYDAAGGDKHLAPHTDDSDVTFNCCLGRRGFEGSGLVFCGELGRPDHRKHSHTFAHRIGGGAEVDYGAEASPPDVVCVSYQHDRDSGRFRPYPDAAAEGAFRGRSWCPPRGKEYPGFRDEEGDPVS
ncbi:procollagen-lysine 5-dioxygenase [Aureococcus anophagefferens]|nr:procollagen-lysine 5-dioxygenase [Aureococcus anophagefferens]